MQVAERDTESGSLLRSKEFNRDTEVSFVQPEAEVMQLGLQICIVNLRLPVLYHNFLTQIELELAASHLAGVCAGAWH